MSDPLSRASEARSEAAERKSLKRSEAAEPRDAALSLRREPMSRAPSLIRSHAGPIAAPAGAGENVGGLGGAPVGADGDDGAAGVELALVIAGLLLGDAQPRQGAKDSADGGAGDGAAEERRHHAARDDRAYARDEHGDGGGQDSTEHAAGDGAGQCAFAVLRAFGVD